MHHLLRRVEREETSRALDGVLPPAGAHLRGEKAAEDDHRTAPERQTPLRDPLVETRVAARERVSAMVDRRKLSQESDLEEMHGLWTCVRIARPQARRRN